MFYCKITIFVSNNHNKMKIGVQCSMDWQIQAHLLSDLWILTQSSRIFLLCVLLTHLILIFWNISSDFLLITNTGLSWPFRLNKNLVLLLLLGHYIFWLLKLPSRIRVLISLLHFLILTLLILLSDQIFLFLKQLKSSLIHSFSDQQSIS